MATINDQIKTTWNDFKSQELVKSTQESIVEVTDITSKHKTVIIWTLIGAGILVSVMIILLIIYNGLRS